MLLYVIQMSKRQISSIFQDRSESENMHLFITRRSNIYRVEFQFHETNIFLEQFIIILKIGKIEKILKGRLDLISSPSPLMKIQIIGGKVCLRCKGKTLLGIVNKFFVFKSLLTTSSNVLPLHFSRP